jgi:putative ABC transport system permease protein
MPWLERSLNVFRGTRLNREIEDEFQYHLDETVDRLMTGGMTEQEARFAARRRLGNHSIQKERTRDMNITGWLDDMFSDLVYGLRQLRLNPGFTAIAILSLALGIGANSAIFQLVDAIRLKTLPVEKPQELAAIDFEKGATRPGSWWGRGDVVSSAQWEQIRDRQQAFSELAAWSADRLNLADGGEPRMAESMYVSADFFRVLGVNALVGRTFSSEDDNAVCNAGAVLSHAFWQREFAGDPAVLQRTIYVAGHNIPVIGVTPATFFGVQVGKRFDVALPLCADKLLATDQHGRAGVQFAWWLSVIGRLKPGWSIAQATANLHTLSPSIMEVTVPAMYDASTVKRFLKNRMMVKEAGTGMSPLREEYDRPLWLLMAITGLVLLIACANLANLLLARALVREREIAVRLALGASRFRVVRQLLSESLLLAFLGSASGILLAIGLSHALVVFITTADNPLYVDLTLDWRMLSFTMGLGVLTCLLFGLLPAWRSTEGQPVEAMRAGSRSVTAGRSQLGLRRLLVASQVALSLVLLFGALLFVRSLNNLLTIDPGFKPEGLLSVNFDFSKATVANTKERNKAVWREMYERLSVIPGVVTTAQVAMVPVGGNSWDGLVGPDATAASTSGKGAYFNWIGPGYFKTMGTPMLAGRDFSDRDSGSSPKVAIVDETFARKLYGGANPVGRTFHMAADAGKAEPVIQIVGLVQKSKFGELREEPKALAFFPMGQNEDTNPAATFVLRVAGSPAGVMTGVKATISSMNQSTGIDFHPMAAQLANSLLRDRLMATLSAGFGLLAALLAALGLYGVIAYMVAQRRNEIGVRMALGADRTRVIRLVLKEALQLLGMGLAGGIVCALVAGKAAASILYGVRPNDIVSLGGASVLLAGISLVASYLPAKRAADFNPMTALRNE